MKETAELDLYLEALRAERTAVLRWDLKTDRVYGENALTDIFPEKLKNISYSEFLLNTLPIHPNDRYYFVSFVEFIKKPHSEYADKTC